MTASQTRLALEFAVIMAQEFPRAAHLTDQLVRLLRLSRRHARLQCDACNGDVPENHDAKCERQIRAVCAEIDPACVPVFSGDPRGCTVKLTVPSKRTNDFGGTGICVPQ